MIYILLTVYLLSAFGAWWYTSKAYYHPNSKFRVLEPDELDWFFVLMPVMNMINLGITLGDWEDTRGSTYKREEITTKLWKTKW